VCDDVNEDGASPRGIGRGSLESEVSNLGVVRVGGSEDRKLLMNASRIVEFVSDGIQALSALILSTLVHRSEWIQPRVNRHESTPSGAWDGIIPVRFPGLDHLSAIGA